MEFQKFLFSYYSPLFIAAMNKHLKCVRLLCSHDKIEINVKNKDGIFKYFCSFNWTPLHAAVNNHDINMVNFLLSCDGINTEIKTNNGLSPYDLARQLYDFQMMSIIRPYTNEPSDYNYNYYYNYYNYGDGDGDDYDDDDDFYDY